MSFGTSFRSVYHFWNSVPWVYFPWPNSLGPTTPVPTSSCHFGGNACYLILYWDLAVVCRRAKGVSIVVGGDDPKKVVVEETVGRIVLTTSFERSHRRFGNGPLSRNLQWPRSSLSRSILIGTVLFHLLFHDLRLTILPHLCRALHRQGFIETPPKVTRGCFFLLHRSKGIWKVNFLTGNKVLKKKVSKL